MTDLIDDPHKLLDQDIARQQAADQLAQSGVVVMGGENRLTGDEVAGSVDTEGEAASGLIGGVAISDSVATALQERIQAKIEPFAGTRSSKDVDSFVATIDAATPDQYINERIVAASTGQPYILDANGQRIKDRNTRSIPEERRITPEQTELVKAVASERAETERVATAAQRGLKSVADTASFLGDVISATPDQYINERIVAASTGQPYILDANGQRIKDRNTRSIPEERRITPEQTELVKAVASERAETERVATAAQRGLKSVADTASFLGDVISATPDQYINERIVAASTGQPYILDANGQRIKDRNTRSIPEERRITPEQTELVKAVAGQIEKIRQSLPQEVRAVLESGLTIEAVIEQITLVEQQKMGSSQVMADVERANATLGSLGELKEVIERCDIYIDLAEALGGGAEQAESMLAVTRIDSVEDKNFVNHLRTVVDTARIKKAADSLLVQEGLPSTAIEIALPLLEAARTPEAKAQAAVLVRYALRRQLIDDYTGVFAGATLDTLNYQQRIKALQSIAIRASSAGFDYATERQSLVDAGTDVLVLGRSAEIRRAFADRAKGVAEIITDIVDLPMGDPEDLQLQEGLFEDLALYLFARRAERPEDFSSLFSELTAQVQDRLRPRFPESLELGRNLRSAKYLANHFKEVIAPIFQAARGDERSRSVEGYIRAKQGYGKGRETFVLDAERLSEQRELTQIEREYLESVEALSIFNPHLAAIASEIPGATRVALESYFDSLSRETTEGLQEGQYFPSLQIGLGPNGLTTLAETVRINPDLAAATLVVDAGALPGGPFAIPRGAAWNLNSANERGSEQPTLPSSPTEISARNGVTEEKTVRAYGSPLPFYPGERVTDSDVRPGSINTTVDYMTTPDDLSDSRYPTNDELALVLQLQAAMLVEKVALSTEVIRISPNPNSGEQGTKLVTLRINREGQEPREVTVKTDEVIIASGLGKPNLGFELGRSRAKSVLKATAAQPADEFPLLSDTLSAFEALASTEGPPRFLGETLLIYGSGNSADTIIEYVGGLFADATNPSIRNVKKIVLVTEQDLSSRPRYSQIRDLRARNGRESLVQFVSGRVGDVELSKDRKTVRLLDKDKQPILDKDGQPLQGNAAIAATGFRSSLDEILRDYIPKGQTIRSGFGLEQVTLPTNPDVSVADRLEADPSIILVGTASRDGFRSSAKTQQLPPEAGQALIRNGVENAVAIGFRRPDDQAARRIVLDQNPELRNFRAERTKKPPREVSLESDPKDEDSSAVSQAAPVPESLPSVRGDLEADSEVLTPLLLLGLQGVQLTQPKTITVNFTIDSSDGDNGKTVNCQFEPQQAESGTEQTITGVSGALTNEVLQAVRDPYFLAYWLNAKSTRRVRDGLRISLSFRHGRLDMKRTFAEPL